VLGNALILRGELEIPSGATVSAQYLLSALGEKLLSSHSENKVSNVGI
jgi:hypothetical protein